MVLYYDEFGELKGSLTKKDILMEIALENNELEQDITWKAITELPEVWQHACTDIGVEFLPEKHIKFADNTEVYYVYCSACGTVIYYIERALF